MDYFNNKKLIADIRVATDIAKLEVELTQMCLNTLEDIEVHLQMFGSLSQDIIECRENAVIRIKRQLTSIEKHRHLILDYVLDEADRLSAAFKAVAV